MFSIESDMVIELVSVWLPLCVLKRDNANEWPCLIHPAVRYRNVAPLSWSTRQQNKPLTHIPWASYQIRKFAVGACAGNAGNVFPATTVSDPDMHRGTCVTHVPWCMPGSVTSSFLWSRWRGKRSRHSRRMRNSQFYVSGKRPIAMYLHIKR